MMDTSQSNRCSRGHHILYPSWYGRNRSSHCYGIFVFVNPLRHSWMRLKHFVYSIPCAFWLWVHFWHGTIIQKMEPHFCSFSSIQSQLFFPFFGFMWCSSRDHLELVTTSKGCYHLPYTLGCVTSIGHKWYTNLIIYFHGAKKGISFRALQVTLVPDFFCKNTRLRL